MHDDFDFRFSSEYYDSETGFVYYNYRYYSSSLGRWLSRDPIGEWGGWNIYGMVDNNPVDYWDYLGLAKCSKCGYNQKLICDIVEKADKDVSSLTEREREYLKEHRPDLLKKLEKSGVDWNTVGSVFSYVGSGIAGKLGYVKSSGGLAVAGTVLAIASFKSTVDSGVKKGKKVIIPKMPKQPTKAPNTKKIDDDFEYRMKHGTKAGNWND